MGLLWVRGLIGWRVDWLIGHRVGGLPRRDIARRIGNLARHRNGWLARILTWVRALHL